MTFENDLAADVARLMDEDLSVDAERRVRLLVLDTVAVSLGASALSMPSVGIVADWARETFDGTGSAAVWGRGWRAPPPVAALINGTGAEVLDFQEVLIHGRNNGHAAVVIVPALIALAETHDVPFRRLLTAVAAALEVNLTILIALGRSHRTEGRGIRTTSLAAPVAAALAGALMIGLSHEQALNAMGIAGGTLPIGLLAAMAPANRDFSMDKDLSVGLSAAHAATAVGLAAHGLTGPSTIVTGERGLLATYATDPLPPTSMNAAGAPNLWRYAMKRFASNFGTQAAVAACLELAVDIPPDRIARVDVRVKSSSAQSLSTRDITNHIGARFSLPYAVASALARQRCTLADFSDAALRDPAVLILMERVFVEGDDALEQSHLREGHFPAVVVVTTLDGATHEKTVLDIWGGVGPEAMADTILQKTRDLLGPAGDGGHADRLAAAVIDGESLGDLSELLRQLSSASPIMPTSVT